MDVRQFAFPARQPCQAGEVGSKTILWNESMDPWRPQDKVPELYDLKVAVSPSLPWSTDPGRAGDSLAARWPRFFARIFDVCWEIALVAVISGFVLAKYFPGFFDWTHKPGAAQLLRVLFLPMALIVDALLHRVAGNTPGKALFRLKVEALDAKSLDFYQYLHRNSLVWGSGLAFGLPLINLLTMASQAHRLGSGRQASYDESLNFWVRSRPLTRVRKIASGFVFVGVLGGISVLSSLDPTAQREWVQYIMQKKSYVWENPLTHLDAKLEPWWGVSTKANKEGQPIYVFSENTGRAKVVFAMEQRGYTLDEYVRAFQKSTAVDVRFSDRGRFFERAGRQHWQGYGGMVKGEGVRLKVEIVQSGSIFWRVVTTQTAPYDYTDVLVERLRVALWSTVK